MNGGFGRGERTLVIGLGRSGRASCEVLLKRGAAVYATDDGPRERIASTIEHVAHAGARFIPPAELPAVLGSLTSCVVSPGVPLTSPLVRAVQEARVSVYSEIEVAYRISKAPLVAVTGTKGKTTTTALVGALFRAAGQHVRVGGNIGNALIGETASASADEWVIAEVSSFQLESIRSFKPKLSTILNLSPDHLDRYHSMDEYGEAKFRIFANQGPTDTFVGNLDDPLIAALQHDDGAKRLRAKTLWFSLRPERAATLYVRDERIVFAPQTGDPRPIAVMPTDEIPLLGRHNVQNVLAALGLGLAAGLDPEALRRGVRDFEPLPHRLQTVVERGGVRYVDDSKSTNPGSVIAALASFDAPIVAIVGGKAKGTDFAALGDALRAKAKAVVLIGEAADALAAVVDPATATRAASMDEAVALAGRLAEPGDVVLLSPGCASFDMFGSAEERGNAFSLAARALVGARD